jgi:hypothetical protein
MREVPTIARSPAARRAGQLWQARRGGIAVVALFAIALSAAGCGGGSPSAGVARLGSSTSAGGSSSSVPPAASGSGESGVAQVANQGVVYGACMRAHGVPNFPDPQVSTHGNEVSVKMAVPVGAVNGNPHFNSAQQACRKLMPGGGPGSGSAPQLSTQEQAQVLKLAACIRAHGVPTFPDPTFSGGGVHVPPTVSVHSATFKSAEQACQSLIPSSLRAGR